MPRPTIIAIGIALAGCASVVIPDGDGGQLDVVGTWRDCQRTLVIGGDGTVTERDHSDACDRTGTYTLAGSELTLVFDGGTCDSVTLVRTALRAPRGLLLVEDNGAVARLADAETPYETWRFDSTSGDRGSSIVRRVGDPAQDPFGSGCYWSADGACGGMFSCGGQLAEWRVDGDMLQASTVCGGGCVCTSLVLGTIDGASIEGTFRGFNCERSIEGAFEGARIEDP
jgi:hypothetical protein